MAAEDRNSPEVTVVTHFGQQIQYSAAESHVGARTLAGSSSISSSSDGPVRGDDEVVGLHEGSTLIFKDVNVVLSKKEIIKGVSGKATVGEILAIMGPSGAGKSTLLNTLAGRVVASSGSITINGEPVSRKARRKISYVLQADVFFPNLTLRETLTFTTLLRLPDKMPYELKIRRMQEIVDALELNKCLDTRIGGTFETGLSGGERKRASIASELLTNPRLLLLDEPTSGLDSAIAYSLMSTMAKYSRQSMKTILTTIHQPSSQIFHMFSKVLLLTEGQVAYFGPGNKIIDFFSRLGLHCDPLYNPADFILEQVKADPETVERILQGAKSLLREQEDELKETPRPEVGFQPESKSSDVTIDVSDDAAKTEHNGRVNFAFTDKSVTVDGFEMLDVEKTRRRRLPRAVKEVDVESYIDEDAKWQTGFLTQYTTLTRRAFVQGKGRFVSPLNLCHVVIMILAGLEWFQLDRTEETMNDRMGILFFLIVNQAFTPALDATFRVFDQFGVFHRERSSGIYRLSTYYLSIMTAEIPFTFVMSAAFAIVVYWMTGLTPQATNFIVFLLLLELSAFVAQSYGFFIGVLVTNRGFVVPIGTTLMIAFLLIGGFYNTHVEEWLLWMRYLSYITFSLSAMGKVEFMYGDPFLCNPPNRTIFPESCLNGTTFEGVAFLEVKNLNFSPFYADVIVLIGLLVLLRILTYIVLRYFRRPKA